MRGKGKSLAALLICYCIWGTQPLYWDLLARYDSMFILCCRIIMSMAFTWLFLACTGRLRELFAAFRDRRVMKYLVPAALFLCFDWALFNWAIANGHVLDTALGYYMNPMVIFITGITIFREKGSALEFAAVLVAFVGVLTSWVGFGSFPVVAVLCAVSWPAYAAVTKAARADSVITVAVETTLLSPLALIASLVFYRGDMGWAGVDAGGGALLILSGLVTATPIVLYVQLANLIHHAMQLEVPELAGDFPFENIDEHDVHHRLHQDIRAVGPHARQFLHPIRVIVVFPHFELQFESVRQRDAFTLQLRIHQVHQRHQQLHRPLVGSPLGIRVREEIQLSYVKTMLFVKLLNVQQLLHQPVVAFHGAKFDVLNDAREVVLAEILVDVTNSAPDVGSVLVQVAHFPCDTADDVGILRTGAHPVLFYLLIPEEIVQVRCELRIVGVRIEFRAEMERILRRKIRLEYGDRLFELLHPALQPSDMVPQVLQNIGQGPHRLHSPRGMKLRRARRTGRKALRTPYRILKSPLLVLQ